MSRVVVVSKRSSYDRYVVEENDARVRGLLERHDPVVKRWRRADEDHRRSLEQVERVLDQLGVHYVLVRNPNAQFDPVDADLVVTVGGDGTMLAASHNVTDVPLLGVNSAPRSSVGFFCAGRATTVQRLIPRALDGALESVTLQRMQVTVNERVRSQRVLNEALFCHVSPAATSRYILTHRRRHEEQRSSGFWVGPAAGSTAAIRSAGGRVLALTSPRLQLVVREPYAAFGKQYRLLRFVIEPGQRATAKSKMRDACMFLDGPYKTVRVCLGDEVTFSLSREPLTVLGLDARRSKVR
jgi:NAD+ kinase